GTFRHTSIAPETTREVISFSKEEPFFQRDRDLPLLMKTKRTVAKTTLNVYSIIHNQSFYEKKDFSYAKEPETAKPAIFCHVKVRVLHAFASPIPKQCTHFLISNKLAKIHKSHTSKIVSEKLNHIKLVVLLPEKFLLSPKYREEFAKHVKEFKSYGYSL